MHGRECRKARSAQRATVIARVEDRALRVEVRDNGARGARPDGSGLVGMADRLSVIDGRLRVESPVGGGTLVSAHIPLPE
jgi:signal transduction histidine kinase